MAHSEERRYLEVENPEFETCAGHLVVEFDPTLLALRKERCINGDLQSGDTDICSEGENTI